MEFGTSQKYRLTRHSSIDLKKWMPTFIFGMYKQQFVQLVWVPKSSLNLQNSCMQSAVGAVEEVNHLLGI